MEREASVTFGSNRKGLLEKGLKEEFFIIKFSHVCLLLSVLSGRARHRTEQSSSFSIEIGRTE